MTGLVLRNTVAASGTSPTTARFGLADKTGKILALSANVNASANWPATPMQVPFTSPYLVSSDDGYYGCFVVNGVWGTTQPTPGIFNSSTALLAGPVGSAPSYQFIWTGQTDLPAVGSSLTISTQSTRDYYFGAY